MERLRKLAVDLRAVVKDSRGQDLIEYALMATLSARTLRFAHGASDLQG